MNRQREHGKPRFKYTDTLMREQGAGGERGGRRTGEVIRGRHKGKVWRKETIMTDRGRQTRKEEWENTDGRA